jgi:hypothetical protein
VVIGVPLPPVTVTVAVNVCKLVILDGNRVTITVGVTFVTVTEFEPDAPLYVEELDASGV